MKRVFVSLMMVFLLVFLRMDRYAAGVILASVSIGDLPVGSFLLCREWVTLTSPCCERVILTFCLPVHNQNCVFHHGATVVKKGGGGRKRGCMPVMRQCWSERINSCELGCVRYVFLYVRVISCAVMV